MIKRSHLHVNLCRSRWERAEMLARSQCSHLLWWIWSNSSLFFLSRAQPPLFISGTVATRCLKMTDIFVILHFVSVLLPWNTWNQLLTVVRMICASVWSSVGPVWFAGWWACSCFFAPLWGVKVCPLFGRSSESFTNQERKCCIRSRRFKFIKLSGKKKTC